MIRKKFKKELKKIVRNYFKGVYSTDVSVFAALSVSFEDENLSSKQKGQLEKFMLLFFWVN